MNELYEKCKSDVAKKYGLGKTLVIGHLPKYYEEAAMMYAEQVNSVDLADVGGSLRELADKYEIDALERYETGDHALSHLHMAAQARYGFEDGWKAAKKQ